MESLTNIWVTVGLFVVALIYASVGQAGATGYIAVFGLAGIDPIAMKSAALMLNLLAAGIGTYQFWRVGRLSWRDIYPFAVLGIPFSLIGGATQLPGDVYLPLVGGLLIVAAGLMVRSAVQRKQPQDTDAIKAPFWPALATGAIIGFVSGTTGTGGGVFLAPVILAMRWGTVRQMAAITAVYNLMNSGAALLGSYVTWSQVPSAMSYWIVAVAAGGVIGAFVGSRLLPDRWMRGVLALLLLAAGAKMIAG